MPRIPPSLGPLSLSAAPAAAESAVAESAVETPADETPADESAADETAAVETAAVEVIAVKTEEEYAPFYAKISPHIKFESMRKVGTVYFVPFSKPVRVQTPVLKLVEFDASAAFKVPRSFAAFVANFEEHLLQAASANRKLWFKKDLSEETLRTSFKTFLTGCTFRAKVGDDFAAFDDEGDHMDPAEIRPPAGVRCILELDGMCFGRTEFGGMWSVSQLRATEPRKCLIDPRGQSQTPDFSSEFL